jgi:hypothetical protein
MSDFAHYDLGHQQQGAVVQVTLAHRANVQLLDTLNFQRYRSGQSYDYVGGEQLRSPARLTVPRTGHWHVAIDLGGASGTIRSSVSVLPRAA